MSSKKNLITAEIDLEGAESRTYVGRLLGLIKDAEFNALVQEEKLMKKIETRPSVPLCHTFMKNDDVVGHRLVMTVKNINGATITSKKMFVSKRLEEVSEVNPTKDTVQLKTADGETIYIEENEKK